ncbi:MAG: Gfo/Idh/MocA family protein [Planctomycetota bacterium]|jgi:predicted dehydrogenase
MKDLTRREFVKKTAVAGAILATPYIAAGQSKKYRVAVIGRTDRGNYGHGLDEVWKQIEQASIVALADEDADGRAKTAKELGVEKTYADYHEMLEKERPQIVSVAPRWIDCHRDMAVACAEVGAHVFLEKPMSRTLREADEIVAAFEKKNLKLAIAHQRRYSPTVKRIKEIIADGKLGDLLELRGRGKEDKRGAGFDLMCLGTHTFDLMRLIAGDPKWCFAEVRAKGKPVTKDNVHDGREGYGPIAGDEINAMYRFGGLAMGYFSSHRAQHGVGDRWGLQLFGSKGIITIGQGGRKPRASWFIDDPTWQPGRSKAKWQQITSAGLGKPEPIKDVESIPRGNRLIALDLIRAIETNTQPKGSMYDGRAALEMIMAVYESHRLKAPVALPLNNRNHPLSLI